MPETHSKRRLPVPVLPPRVPNYKSLNGVSRSCLSDSEQQRHSRHKFLTSRRDIRNCMQKQSSHGTVHAHSDAEASNLEQVNACRSSKFSSKYSSIKQLLLRHNQTDQSKIVNHDPNIKKADVVQEQVNKLLTKPRKDKEGTGLRITSSCSAEPLNNCPTTFKNLSKYQSLKCLKAEEKVLLKQLHGSALKSTGTLVKDSNTQRSADKSIAPLNKISLRDGLDSTQCKSPFSGKVNNLDTRKRLYKAEQSSKVVITSKKKFFDAKSFKFLMKIPGLSHFHDKRTKVKIPEYTTDTLSNSLSFVRTVRITKTSEASTNSKTNDAEENTGSLIRVYQKTTTILAPIEKQDFSSDPLPEHNAGSLKKIPKPPEPRSYKVPSRQNLLVGINHLQRPKDKPPSIPADLNICGLPETIGLTKYKTQQDLVNEDPEMTTPEYLREQVISPARRPPTSQSQVIKSPLPIPIVTIHVSKSRFLDCGRVQTLATINESGDKSGNEEIGNTSSPYTQDRYDLPEPWDFIQSRLQENISCSSQSYPQLPNFSRATKSASCSPRRREVVLDPGGFRHALITHPPSPPPSLLRRLGTKEISGLGKVKVVVRVSGEGRDEDSILQVDTKKRQITLVEQDAAKPSPQDRRPAVAAPKMFAFDALFTPNEPQSDVCSSALTDLIHAVLNGVDSCLFSFGQQTSRKMETMIGTCESTSSMGAIPCAISWLYRCISEQKQKTGMKFSIRVSALEVAAPTWQTKDLLAHHALESCEGSAFMSQGQVELRAPSVEQAAYYLDSALASRSHQHSHFFYTLHLYQYSVAGKGAVSGGRSRLHLIDLGSCGKTPGGIPLSGIGNILLAIFNGQKHFPHKEHKLTQQLRDCLGSLTCHAAMVAHVSPLQSNYTDTLTTLQFASRVHRMRRRKFKFLGNSCIVAGEDSNRLTGSSDFDPSSSEQSADTVIYLGPSEETDGEHPPVYIPSLNSGDNRGSLSKVLKGSILDQKTKIVSKSVPGSPQKTLSEVAKKISSGKGGASSARSSPVRLVKPATGSREERWIDGPRVARNRGRDHHGPEMWVDGPKKHSDSTKSHYESPKHYELQKALDSQRNHFDSPTKNNFDNPRNHFELPKNYHGPYGFMDQHKKNMIRQWVENQYAHISKPKPSPKVEPNQQAPPVIHPINRVQSELPLEKLQCSGPKSPDVVDEMEVEIIEVEEPVEPVPMQDSCLQVTEEDIALCMGELENPLPEVDQEEHPLRILSQENLTIVSTFTGNSTDSLTATHELERLFPPNHKIFNKSNLWQEEDSNDIISSKLGSQYDSLSRLHELYENRIRRTVEAKVSRSHSLMLSNILQDNSDYDANSIASEPAYLPGENKNEMKIQKDLSSQALFKTNPNNLYQNIKSIRNCVEADGPEDEEEVAVPPPLTSDHLLTLSRHSIGFENGKGTGNEDGKNIRNGVHDPGGPLEYWRREEWSWSENYMKLSRDMSSTNRSYLATYGHTGHSMFDQRNPVHHTTNP